MHTLVQSVAGDFLGRLRILLFHNHIPLSHYCCNDDATVYFVPLVLWQAVGGCVLGHTSLCGLSPIPAESGLLDRWINTDKHPLIMCPDIRASDT